jgi:tetratricopeptide (TPR) repeat protein
MADAAAARLYALRGENRNAARAGVRARNHFVRARTLDASLADANMGLGLYNYYVDTLSAMARVMRFFMGIPGGSRQEGVRLLEQAIADGVLTSNLARFYLALNLHRYDQQYEKALDVIGPLAEKYPANPLFQLARGDLYAKLGRKQKALACYRAAAALVTPDRECQARLRELVRVSVEALGASEDHSSHRPGMRIDVIPAGMVSM